MLDSIKDFLLYLIEPIVSLVDFVIQIVGDLVYVIQLVGSFAVNIPYYFSWLPSEIVTIIIIIFGVVVIYKILGREG